MSSVAHFSLVEYDRMFAAGVFEPSDGRRLELIRGEIREMNPIGPEHEIAVDYLNEWSITSLPPGEVWVRVQNSIGLSELESAPEPDLAWVKRRDYSAGRPTGEDVLLLVEVSESSLAYDRGEKADLNATVGIADYWVVNLRDRVVEVFRDPEAGNYRSHQIVASGSSVAPLHYPQLSLVLDSLWP